MVYYCLYLNYIYMGGSPKYFLLSAWGLYGSQFGPDQHNIILKWRRYPALPGGYLGQENINVLLSLTMKEKPEKCNYRSP